MDDRGDGERCALKVCNAAWARCNRRSLDINGTGTQWGQLMLLVLAPARLDKGCCGIGFVPQAPDEEGSLH
jgi:hypothetical protein